MSGARGARSPIVELVAVAVIIFAAIYIGMITGLIPGLYSKNIPPQTRPCPNCGVVESIRQIEDNDRGSGAGGLPGAVTGRQTGADRGKIPGTVSEAAGGASTGNVVGQHVNETTHYEVAVRMSDGSIRTINQRLDPVVHAGDSVKVADSSVSRE
jgi:outer membrane lipoprotein SlyB